MSTSASASVFHLYLEADCVCVHADIGIKWSIIRLGWDRVHLLGSLLLGFSFWGGHQLEREVSDEHAAALAQSVPLQLSMTRV